jgi:hypothetical protein
MKNFWLAIGLVITTNVGFAQIFGDGLYQTTVTVKDGMDRDVDTKFKINQNPDAFNLEQAVRNYYFQLTGGSADEFEKKSLDLQQHILHLYLGTMAKQMFFETQRIVKWKTTWIPKEIILTWDDEKNRYQGLAKGYAQNAYGVTDAVSAIVYLDALGNVTGFTR